MNIEQYRDYCIAKEEVTEHFPFDNDTLVFKVCNKDYTALEVPKSMLAYSEGEKSSI